MTARILFLLLLIAGCDQHPSSPPAKAEAASPAPATAPVAPVSDALSTSRPATQVTELPTVELTLNGHVFTLEIADEPHEQQKGLMFRQSLAADAGMIFVFEEEDRRGFWMKNTYLPLDILYIAADGRIVSIQKMYPLDESSYDSIWPAQYAIELNAGTAARIGLKSGDVVAIPDTVKPGGGRR